MVSVLFYILQYILYVYNYRSKPDVSNVGPRDFHCPAELRSNPEKTHLPVALVAVYMTPFSTKNFL